MKSVEGIAITEANRFSNFVRQFDTAGMAELERWQQWFAKSGIKAVIARTQNGFAVYRDGLEECPE